MKWRGTELRCSNWSAPQQEEVNINRHVLKISSQRRCSTGKEQTTDLMNDAITARQITMMDISWRSLERGGRVCTTANLCVPPQGYELRVLTLWLWQTTEWIAPRARVAGRRRVMYNGNTTSFLAGPQKKIKNPPRSINLSKWGLWKCTSYWLHWCSLRCTKEEEIEEERGKRRDLNMASSKQTVSVYFNLLS